MQYSQLVHFLRTEGYEEVRTVIKSGDFHIYGDLIVVWPVNQLWPIRLHYMGEEVERYEKWQPLDEKVVYAEDSPGQWRLSKAAEKWLENRVSTENGTIRPGDYIVHPHHGIGIFVGISTRRIDLEERLYVVLEYANNDRIFYPYERATDLMPYYGGKHPRLTRLYSKSWEHTKEKVQKDLIGIARGLLKVYAARTVSERPAYSVDQEWLRKVEAGVDFQLTLDQDRAWKEILYDLTQSAHPMDRLVCGDVGFGKTELAIRAAALALSQGKQVALIAPTTVLAEQHYSLFQQRLAELPVRVGHLSRITQAEDKAIVQAVAAGELDLVIGTHRILGKDVSFKDLGLLIIDEEQKFGVAQKERLKKMRPTVDILSLSATPIPRTLYMALSGLRGMSTLNRAPKGRLPIHTKVLPYSDHQLGQAIQVELERGGQVYIVHNRVRSIRLVEDKVRELLGQYAQRLKKPATVAVAHGQMEERALAVTMSQFLAGAIDVLIASTIVENGLDSPYANTLLVLHSERFGLADLYQLRGRVGRRSTQAQAYFFTGGIEYGSVELSPEETNELLTKKAQQRLAVLQRATELGSGWSVAIRDLEIRGGGNILGHEQHGSMEAVGLLLYSQLLQEEIGKQAKKLGIRLFQGLAFQENYANNQDYLN